MPVVAPPDTHEVIYNDDPDPVIVEEPRRLPDLVSEPEEADDPDNDICHISVNGRTLCGTDGRSMPLSGLNNPASSPCEGGCGYARCRACASLA